MFASYASYVRSLHASHRSDFPSFITDVKPCEVCIPKSWSANRRNVPVASPLHTQPPPCRRSQPHPLQRRTTWQYSLPQRLGHSDPPTWMLYRAHKAKELADFRAAHLGRPASLPEHLRAGKGALTKIMAELWKNETAEVREHYHHLAEQAKVDHKQRYPDYRYRPRRRGTSGRHGGNSSSSGSGGRGGANVNLSGLGGDMAGSYTVAYLAQQQRAPSTAVV
ncbi:hypothetical protein V8E36_001571 [Tilletia maclaganii]